MRDNWLQGLLILGVLFGVAECSPHAFADGLDTAAGVTDFPFNVQGQRVMDMTASGVGIMGNVGYVAAAPSGRVAGQPCTNPAHTILTATSDTALDLLACVEGIWQSVIYGKNSFPKNHPVITANAFNSSCSGYTDANGIAYLSSSVSNGGAWIATHILYAGGGGPTEQTYICLADTTGITQMRMFNGNVDAGFASW